MKTKFILAMTVAAALLCSQTANAQFFKARQAPKNEFCLDIGFGYFPRKNHFDSCPTKSSIGSGWSDGYKHPFGQSYNLTYLYNLTNRLGIGMQAGLEDIYDQATIYNEYYFKDNVAEISERNFYYIMPTARLYVVSLNHFAIYARVAGGVGFSRTKEIDNNPHDDLDFNCGTKNDTYFAYQVSPFCIEAGGEHIRVFSELGYGCQGYYTIGIKFAY